MTGVISYPTPAYQNVPIEPQFYKPQRFVISAIGLGQTTLVTTTIQMDYEIGQLVRLLIPQHYGCRQLNQQTGYVLSIPTPNQVVVAIDSSIGIDPYFASAYTTQAQIVAVGDINTGFINNTQGRIRVGKHIPGSFINISPFQGIP